MGGCRDPLRGSVCPCTATINRRGATSSTAPAVACRADGRSAGAPQGRQRQWQRRGPRQRQRQRQRQRPLPRPLWALVALLLAALPGPASANRFQPPVPLLPHASVLDRDVIVDGVPLREALSHIYNWSFSVPTTQLQRAAVYMGPNQRLRGLLQRAIDGRLPNNNTMSIGVVGGSIAWGHGASVRGRTDFFSVFVSYMRRAFPNVNFVERNGCVPGTPAVYMLMCLEQHVDDDVDLLFLEYIVNDGFVDGITTNIRVRVMERLLRRVLSKPHYPAPVLLQMPSHGQAFRRDSDEFRPFHITPEDQYGALALYYDAAWLSMRQAFLQRLGGGEGADEALAGGLRFMDPVDGVHPNDLGHKVMADAAVWMVQQTVLSLVLVPQGEEELMYLERRALPPPMHKGNHHADHKVCMHELALVPAVVSTNGFVLMNEGTPEKHKWGYVANASGSELLLEVNTVMPSASEEQGTVALYVAHLKSYEHMGTAQISCSSGCSCTPVTVDGHQNIRESTTYLARLDATRHASCVVAVEVLPQTSSGEHKFKVTGVMVSDKSGSGESEMPAGNNFEFSAWDRRSKVQHQRHPALGTRRRA